MNLEQILRPKPDDNSATKAKLTRLRRAFRRLDPPVAEVSQFKGFEAKLSGNHFFLYLPEVEGERRWWVPDIGLKSLQLLNTRLKAADFQPIPIERRRRNKTEWLE